MGVDSRCMSINGTSGKEEGDGQAKRENRRFLEAVIPNPDAWICILYRTTLFQKWIPFHPFALDKSTIVVYVISK